MSAQSCSSARFFTFVTESRITRHKANHTAGLGCPSLAAALPHRERMPTDRSCGKCGQASELPAELEQLSLRDVASTSREPPGYLALDRGRVRARRRPRWLVRRPVQERGPSGERHHRQGQYVRARMKKPGDDDRAAKRATEPGHSPV